MPRPLLRQVPPHRRHGRRCLPAIDERVSTAFGNSRCTRPIRVSYCGHAARSIASRRGDEEDHDGEPASLGTDAASSGRHECRGNSFLLHGGRPKWTMLATAAIVAVIVWAVNWSQSSPHCGPVRHLCGLHDVHGTNHTAGLHSCRRCVVTVFQRDGASFIPATNMVQRAERGQQRIDSNVTEPRAS